MIVAGMSGECHEKVIDRRDGDVLVAASRSRVCRYGATGGMTRWP